MARMLLVFEDIENGKIEISYKAEPDSLPGQADKTPAQELAFEILDRLFDEY